MDKYNNIHPELKRINTIGKKFIILYLFFKQNRSIQGVAKIKVYCHILHTRNKIDIYTNLPIHVKLNLQADRGIMNLLFSSLQYVTAINGEVL